MLSAQTNKRIGQAMCDYSMLDDGDHVLVAVSGGIDSLVLLWLLQYWKKKAPVSYSLHPVHIDMDIWEPNRKEVNPVHALMQQMQTVGAELHVEKSLPLSDSLRTCFRCSKLRRKQLFDLARRFKCNKIAFGHHKDDLIETLLLNMFYSGNISTMVPRQELFEGKLTVIRPLAYIEKKEVVTIGQNVGLHAVSNLCPLAGETRRDEVRQIVENICRTIPGAKASLFASMKNVRKGYML